MTEFKPPVVLLVNPQLGENIGMAARAMANFELTELRIVEPRDGWPNEKALAASSGASFVIETAVAHDTIEPAIADLDFIYATTARRRDMIKPVMSPEQAAADMRRRATAGGRTGILFGRERWGLNNDEVALADALIIAPVNPQFASLNIAQAVLLIGYEWYKPLSKTLGVGSQQAPASAETGLNMPGTRLATKAELLGFYEQFEGELDKAGYFRTPGVRAASVRNLRNMFNRAGLTEQEVRSMRGIVRALTRDWQRHHPKPDE